MKVQNYETKPHFPGGLSIVKRRPDGSDVVLSIGPLKEGGTRDAVKSPT
ncbi:MAG: hypothetical protein ACREPE_08320 [Lysobacter sp.]